MNTKINKKNILKNEFRNKIHKMFKKENNSYEVANKILKENNPDDKEILKNKFPKKIFLKLYKRILYHVDILHKNKLLKLVREERKTYPDGSNGSIILRFYIQNKKETLPADTSREKTLGGLKGE